ncbi:MAG TPA: preprotein translocase subunit SecE [Acidimicrobiales bacterium]|nr:preprotein translocase subunit SecE [Acidimicrobiales bacterium]
MNRQQRRLLARQGQGEAVGDLQAPSTVEAPGAADFAPRPAAAPPAAPGRRTSPRQFLHEVNVELRKVAWPTRSETANYATVVFIALAVLMALIFALDLGFSDLANFLFK